MSSTLTPKEERITALVVQGMKNHEISIIIGTTENVIENYLRIIFHKTGTWTRLELALWYLENRLGDQIPNETSTAKTMMSTNSGTATPGNNVRSSATKSARLNVGLSFAPPRIVAR